MKLAITLELDIDIVSWGDEYGIRGLDIKPDVAQYVLQSVAGAPAFTAGCIRDVEVSRITERARAPSPRVARAHVRHLRPLPRSTPAGQRRGPRIRPGSRPLLAAAAEPAEPAPSTPGAGFRFRGANYKFAKPRDASGGEYRARESFGEFGASLTMIHPPDKPPPAPSERGARRPK